MTALKKGGHHTRKAPFGKAENAQSDDFLFFLARRSTLILSGGLASVIALFWQLEKIGEISARSMFSRGYIGAVVYRVRTRIAEL